MTMWFREGKRERDIDRFGTVSIWFQKMCFCILGVCVKRRAEDLIVSIFIVWLYSSFSFVPNRWACSQMFFLLRVTIEKKKNLHEHNDVKNWHFFFLFFVLLVLFLLYSSSLRLTYHHQNNRNTHTNEMFVWYTTTSDSNLDAQVIHEEGKNPKTNEKKCTTVNIFILLILIRYLA